MNNRLNVLMCTVFPVLCLVLTIVLCCTRGLVAGLTFGGSTLPICAVFAFVAYIEHTEKEAK